MKVRLKTNMVPGLTEILGNKIVDFDFNGKTLKELINELIGRYGTKIKKTLFNEDNEFDPMIVVAVNKKAIRRENFDYSLNEGDLVIFMLFLGGG